MRSDRFAACGGAFLFAGVVLLVVYNVQLYRTDFTADLAPPFVLLLGTWWSFVGSVVLLARPAPLLRLNRAGWIAFAALALVVPHLCWLPWMAPPLREDEGIGSAGAPQAG